MLNFATTHVICDTFMSCKYINEDPQTQINMALKSAKQVLRKEIKRRVAALSNEEKLRQSTVVTQKVCEYISVISSLDYNLYPL